MQRTELISTPLLLQLHTYIPSSSLTSGAVSVTIILFSPSHPYHPSSILVSFLLSAFITSHQHSTITTSLLSTPCHLIHNHHKQQETQDRSLMNPCPYIKYIGGLCFNSPLNYVHIDSHHQSNQFLWHFSALSKLCPTPSPNRQKKKTYLLILSVYLNCTCLIMTSVLCSNAPVQPLHLPKRRCFRHFSSAQWNNLRTMAITVFCSWRRSCRLM